MEFEGFINVFKPEAFNKCKKDPLSWAWQVEGLAKCVYRIWAGWGRKLRTHGSRLTRVWHLGSNPAETRSYWCDGISDLIMMTHIWRLGHDAKVETCAMTPPVDWHTYTSSMRLILQQTEIERYLFLLLVITSIRIILGSFPCFAWKTGKYLCI